MQLTFRISLFSFLLIFLGSFSLEANILILNGLTHEAQLLPGEKYQGSIQVQNASNQEKSVKIYQTDYWFASTGESRHDQPGTLKRSNASWISVSQLFVTLKPNEIKSVDFEVLVPQNDSLTGTYWSVIMLEGMEPPDTTNAKTGVTINTVLRYAVQVITNIGETGTYDLEFLKLGLNRGEEGARLEVDLGNRGERVLRPEMGLELFDANGNSQGVIKAERKRIYPGTSARIVLNLAAIKPGNYSGVLIADCDEDHIFGSNVNLEL